MQKDYKSATAECKSQNTTNNNVHLGAVVLGCLTATQRVTRGESRECGDENVE